MDKAWTITLERLLNGDSLTQRQAGELMHALAAVDMDPVLAGAMLAALRAKGESAEELRGFATVMRELAVDPGIPGGPPTVDIVGTGGDGFPVIGDTFIESGAIATSFDTGVSRLTYGFSLMRSERMDLQLKAGLHVASLDVGLQLSGNVCDPTTVPTTPPDCPADTTGVEEEEVTAPLPHFGGSFAYAISPSVALRLQAIGFAIELDSIDGSLFEADADLTWQPSQHFGGGIGLRYFNTNVESTGSDMNGEFDFEYFGPIVFIQATF